MAFVSCENKTRLKAEPENSVIPFKLMLLRCARKRWRRFFPTRVVAFRYARTTRAQFNLFRVWEIRCLLSQLLSALEDLKLQVILPRAQGRLGISHTI